jgi:hypothetical protein
VKEAPFGFHLMMFSIINRLYLSARGLTTNEAFKWEMVQDGIYRGEIWKWDSKKSGSSSGYFWRDIEPLENSRGVPPLKGARMVKEFAEVPNLYDKGIIRNLLEVLFPTKV